MKTNIIVAALAIAILFSCNKSIDPTTGDESHPVVSNNDSSSEVLPAQLSKGINLSNWFEDVSSPAQYANRFTPDHFATIKRLGLLMCVFLSDVPFYFSLAIPLC